MFRRRDVGLDEIRRWPIIRRLPPIENGGMSPSELAKEKRKAEARMRVADRITLEKQIRGEPECLEKALTQHVNLRLLRHQPTPDQPLQRRGRR